MSEMFLPQAGQILEVNAVPARLAEDWQHSGVDITDYVKGLPGEFHSLPAARWLSVITKIPLKPDGASIGWQREHTQTAHAFATGARLALKGVKLVTPEKQVIPTMLVISGLNMFGYNQRYREIMESKGSINDRVIWSESMHALAEVAYVDLQSHRDELSLWGGQLGLTGEDGLYFNRGYTTLLYLAREIIHGRARESFVQDMRSRVFSDEELNELEPALTYMQDDGQS